MVRVAIYARYSSDRQTERSIEDQIRICRQRADREGWSVSGTFADHALSGASRQRPELLQMIARAGHGEFDIILAEALDRLSRDQEDTAWIHKGLNFRNIKIVTLSEGEITELHVGISSTMNAVFLKQLAAKTHRGQLGVVIDGRVAGGNAYGYDVVQRDGKIGRAGLPQRGHRAINVAEAAVIRQIFKDYIDGQSPRQIAHRLNAAGLPGPRGGAWTASLLLGNAERGIGLLRNALYVGRLIWNRQRFIKNPSTGKRQARLNPACEWIVHEVPQLRIIEDDMWDRAQARLLAQRKVFKQPEGATNRLNPLHRPRHLLSGLVRCGLCNGTMAIGASGRRLVCTSHRERGTCTNGRTVKQDVLQSRVLDGIKTHLAQPALIEHFVGEYVRLQNERRRSAVANRAGIENRLRRLEAKEQQLTRALLEQDDIAPLLAASKALAVELSAVRQELAAEPEPPPAIHPNIAGLYARKVAELESCLSDPATLDAARGLLTTMISHIVIHPGQARGAYDLELVGDLAALLELGSPRPQKSRSTGGMPDVAVSLVAGARFELTTFRL
nr:recombinase family protein [Oleomonas cavernae]